MKTRRSPLPQVHLNGLDELVQRAISSEPGAVVNRCRWLGVTSECNNSSGDEGLLNTGSELMARCTNRSRRCPSGASRKGGVPKSHPFPTG